MLTIFSIPKPFLGNNRIIQRNAIKSWMLMKPECEILLFGNDEGVSETAAEFGLRHIPGIAKNEYGTPLLSSAFDIAQKEAQFDTLMYVNADIITEPNLLSKIARVNWDKFLICGRRWDLNISEEINFDNNVWAENLVERIERTGFLHGCSGLDYFIFPKKLINMPAFAVGRPGWDTWLIYDMRSRKVAVIDATEAITIIHQNHDYSHSKFGQEKRVGGPEWHKNRELAGGLSCMLTLRDADWVLGESGIKRPLLLRRIASQLSLFYPWRKVLALKRTIQEKFANR